MKLSIKQFYILGALSLIFVSGCGKKLPADLPKLYPASVTVIQDGKPLEGATVQLIPKGFDSRWSAAGVTDAAGKITFYTHGQYLGVPEGTYFVTVFKIYSEPSQYANKSQPDDIDYLTWEKMLVLESEKLKSYNYVNTLYGSRDTTPLEFKVGPGGETNQQFDVGKAINEEIK